MSAWIAIFVGITFIVFIVFLTVLLLSKNGFTKKKVSLQPVTGLPKTYFRFMDTLSNKTSLPLDKDTYSDVFKEHGIVIANSSQDAEIIFFETLNTIDHIITMAPYGPRTAFVYGVRGTDELASKSMLAFNIRSRVSLLDASKVLPVTFIYEVPSDMQVLYRDIKMESNLYILKQNVQRQEGNLITQDPQTIMDAGRKGFVVAQRLLLNPLLVGGRKINMRVYMLVVVRPNKLEAEFYIYDDGFIYYAPKLWDATSTDPNVHITTGYIDRKVYDDNPLTIKDLMSNIGKDRFATMWGNVKTSMSLIKKTYSTALANENKDVPGVKFLVYGCDLAPDETFNIKIMEINKGPDLSYKDERDKRLKMELVRHTLSTVGIIKSNGSKSSFVKL